MWPRRSPYQHAFGAAFTGLLFLVTGLIGLDLRWSRGWFRGAEWTGEPVWWQVNLGFMLALMGGYLLRRAWERSDGGAK